jgi:DNA-binding CsgD family transcriptional regulator
MGEDRFDKLTERQKECLRLVAHGLEVKEIARELDLSPTAVIERLRGARRVLGVESSREAARRLAVYQEAVINIRHVDMPQPVADMAYPLPSSAASKGIDGTEGPYRLQEVSAPFATLDPSVAAETRSWSWPWRGKGVRSNDLTSSQRLLASGGLTIAVALAVAILLIAVVQLMSFLLQISRHGG